jgi:DNA-binding XRE family transcriptional regulator
MPQDTRRHTPTARDAQREGSRGQRHPTRSGASTFREMHHAYDGHAVPFDEGRQGREDTPDLRVSGAASRGARWTPVPEVAEAKFRESEGRHFDHQLEQAHLGATAPDALRTRQGRPAGGLAEKSGLSREYVARLETGQHNPGLATLQKLAKALGVPVTALLE